MFKGFNSVVDPRTFLHYWRSTTINPSFPLKITGSKIGVLNNIIPYW
ncbi:MAG: hypothetical protein ACOX6Z_06460 [Dethiobacteria bacterium]